MFNRMTRPAAAALALSLGLTLAACGGTPANRSLNSVRQPVVQQENFVLDLRSTGDGVDISEQKRLADWFDTMGLRYGDRVSIDDPTGSIASRGSVAKLAGRHGILLSEGAPTTVGFVNPGTVRVIITRSTASVPGCPDWSDSSSFTFSNATHSNYGCSINSNLAAMVANPEHLLQGAVPEGETYVSGSAQAIETYRKKAGTGAGAPSGGGSSSSSGGN